MKYTWAILTMIALGGGGLVVIVMFEFITINNDSEYYVLKEAMEAAMVESVDVACFRTTTNVDEDGCNGGLKMSEQKFVENFTRRFAENIVGSVDDYTIDFYDIMEMPPKASVVISSTDSDFQLVTDSVDIQNSLSGILETGVGSYELVLADDTGADVDDEFEIPDGDSSDGDEVSVDTDGCDGTDCHSAPSDAYGYSCVTSTSSDYALEISDSTIDVELPFEYYLSNSYSIDSSTGKLSLDGDVVEVGNNFLVHGSGSGSYDYKMFQDKYVCSDGSQSCTSGYKLYTNGKFDTSNDILITQAYTFEVVASNVETIIVCDYDD